MTTIIISIISSIIASVASSSVAPGYVIDATVAPVRKERQP